MGLIIRTCIYIYVYKQLVCKVLSAVPPKALQDYDYSPPAIVPDLWQETSSSARPTFQSEMKSQFLVYDHRGINNTVYLVLIITDIGL